MALFIHGFWRDERGSTAIEYALIAGAIFLAIVTSLTQVGTALNTSMTEVNNGFSGH